MKRSLRKLLMSVSISLLAVTGLAGCDALKKLEKSCDVTFEGGTPFTETHVTTFNNGLTPTVEASAIPEEHKFFGWTCENPEEVSYDDPDFGRKYVRPNAIVRYQDVEKYLVDGKATMKPLYIHRDILNKYYLVVGWYAKTGTSGLAQGQIDAWTADLHAFLRSSLNATDEDIANTVIRAYDGNVADMGAKINDDDDVDFLVGVGNNINSTGGVKIKEKTNKDANGADMTMGGKIRYVARLTDRPVCVAAYQWLLTTEGHASLA